MILLGLRYLGVASALTLFTASVAQAFPTLHPNALTPGVMPPNQATLACTTCHVNSGGGLGCANAPCFNPFGLSYRLAPTGWAGIQGADADSDGLSNSTELGVTVPGFPNAATGVSCDMGLCATNGTFACGANVSCTGVASPYTMVPSNRYAYSFGFTCAPHTSGTLFANDSSWADDCQDIDECAGNPCGVGMCNETALGAWVAPGYTCDCPMGYVPSGGTCALVDECTSNVDDCVPVATCVDPSTAVGDFTCTCPLGAYVGDGHASGTGCANVNECLDANAFSCMPHATCADTVGGYDCVCNAGYSHTGDACVDTNECANEDACPSQETCENSEGSYACLCPVGESRPVSGGACTILCGDGTRHTSEACDDGDLEAGDGCGSTCAVESGWFCSGNAGSVSACAATCGDALIDPPETCDDGSRNSDTLPNACRTRCALAYCGDGVIDTGEVCDRGGLAPADANPALCTATGCLARDAGVDRSGTTFGGGGGCSTSQPVTIPSSSVLGAVALAFLVSARASRARRGPVTPP